MSQVIFMFGFSKKKSPVYFHPPDDMQSREEWPLILQPANESSCSL